MSDDEYETTRVQVEKPKKERTPAQKAATARALEALAAAREAKKEVKPTPRPTGRPPASRPPPARKEPEVRNTISYYEEEEHEEPKPARRPAIKPSAPDYGDDIRALSEGLHGVISYIENKEQKKKKKVVLPPSESEDSSSEEEEVVIKPKRKTKPMKAAPAPTSYNLNNVDPQDVLRSIFFRNH